MLSVSQHWVWLPVRAGSYLGERLRRCGRLRPFRGLILVGAL